MTQALEKAFATGRASRDTGTASLRALWQRAAKLEALPAGGEWVPWQAVVIREELSPRASIDTTIVSQYREVIDETPPVVVQRDTFVLIEGRHRLEAQIEASSDFIRIVEEDCPEDELFERGVALNTRHGRRLSAGELKAAALQILTRHPAWPSAQVAQICGVHRATVHEWRNREQQPPVPKPRGTTQQSPKQEPEPTGLDVANAKTVDRIAQALNSVAHTGIDPGDFWKMAGPNARIFIRGNLDKGLEWLAAVRLAARQQSGA